MSFLSTALIKIFLILFITSYIAIAGPVPDKFSNDLSVEGREQASGGSVSSSKQAAGGDSLLSDGDFLEPSVNDGQGRKASDLAGQPRRNRINKGHSQSTKHKTGDKQGDTVEPASPFSTFGESPQGGSEDGGSVTGGGNSIVSLLSGNGGEGGGEKVGGIDILNILGKRNL